MWDLHAGATEMVAKNECNNDRHLRSIEYIQSGAQQWPPKDCHLYFRCHELHWLDVADRIKYRLCQHLRMSTWHGTTILVWALHTVRRDAWTSSSSHCWPQTAAYSKVLADKLWWTFVLLCCHIYMELSARCTERHWPVISFVLEAAQDISVQSILAHQAR